MNETRDERLRRILRAADSADVETRLTTEEIRAMRRAVLTATPEPRRRFVPAPAWLGAAIAVLAVLMMWPRPESKPPTPPAPPRIAVENSRTDVKGPDTKRTEDVNRRTKAVAAGLRARRPAAPSGKTPTKEQDRIATAGPAPDNEEEPRTRQIQFATPGGTRVIWILTSDKAL